MAWNVEKNQRSLVLLLVQTDPESFLAEVYWHLNEQSNPGQVLEEHVGSGIAFKSLSCPLADVVFLC